MFLTFKVVFRMLMVDLRDPFGFDSGNCCCILTFDPAKHAISKWCTGRKWHIPMASNRKKSRRRIWQMKWDKVKAHDTLIDWCTGREWPLNCITVISTWWRSNMPFQRLSGLLSGLLRGRLNYYITRWGQEVRSWRSDELETRCGKESHHPAEGALGTPDGVWGPDQLLIRCGRESLHPAERAPRPPVEQPWRTRKMAIRVGVNILQFCSVSNSLSHANVTNKVRGIFFLKKLPSFFIIVSLWFFLHESAYDNITLFW